MILAFAGVHRLNLDAHIRQIIPFEIMLPAVGQGAMAIEIRSDDDETRSLVEKLNDEAAQACAAAERGFLRRLEGGCQFPIGANAVLRDGMIYLEGMAGNLDGSVNLREKISGEKAEAEDLGKRLAEILIEKGAGKLLEQTRERVEATEEKVI
jgi:hydroxymethylbilane synthase